MAERKLIFPMKITLPVATKDFSSSLLALMEKAWESRLNNFTKVLYVSRPTLTESISVTGHTCALNCKHCRGHYLSSMTSLETLHAPADIHGKSCLISGGCTPEGKVPILPALKKLAALKEKHRYLFHVGLVSEEEIKAFAPLADAVSFDFVGDDETIKETLKLSKTVADYVTCFKTLRKYCQHVIPHICIGLKGGHLAGERNTVDILARENVERLIFIVLRPTPHTDYANVNPPSLAEIAQLLAETRLKLPRTPLYLGCMRPGGNYRTDLDLIALACGLNGIVQPSPAVLQEAERVGLALHSSEECCAF
jgi:uncharacterized radical SAM superfamily protein